MTYEEVEQRGQAVRSVMFKGVDTSSIPTVYKKHKESSAKSTFIMGDVWADPDLDLKSRSCVTLGIFIALNRPHELAIHFQIARNNGLSRKELEAVCHQASVYAGNPACIDALRVLENTPDPAD